MPRHKFTKDQQSLGGKNQPIEVKVAAGQKGFLVTISRHPWMWPYLRHAPGMSHFKEGKFAPEKQEGEV